MREVSFVLPEQSKQDKMREYNKKYREQHSGIVHCKCGGVFKEISKYTHAKTKKHSAGILNGRTFDGGRTDDIGGRNGVAGVSGVEVNTGEKTDF